MHICQHRQLNSTHISSTEHIKQWAWLIPVLLYYYRHNSYGRFMFRKHDMERRYFHVHSIIIINISEFATATRRTNWIPVVVIFRHNNTDCRANISFLKTYNSFFLLYHLLRVCACELWNYELWKNESNYAHSMRNSEKTLHKTSFLFIFQLNKHHIIASALTSNLDLFFHLLHFHLSFHRFLSNAHVENRDSNGICRNERIR